MYLIYLRPQKSFAIKFLDSRSSNTSLLQPEAPLRLSAKPNGKGSITEAPEKRPTYTNPNSPGPTLIAIHTRISSRSSSDGPSPHVDLIIRSYLPTCPPPPPQPHPFIPPLNRINIHPPRKYVNFPPRYDASPNRASHLPNAYASHRLDLSSRTTVQEQISGTGEGKLCCKSTG
jgi:hypothetical protein